MRYALAAYGTRGDVEPSVAVGRELMRRGHDVAIAVPPNLIELAETAGISAVQYGPDVREFWDDDFFRNFIANFIRSLWTIREPIRLLREAWEPVTRFWADMSTTLTALADGADLLFSGQLYQDLAVNVAEYYDIPLATLHYFPMRPHGQLLPIVPSALVRSTMVVNDWFIWRMNKRAEDAQRLGLGLAKATSPSPRRIASRGSLELQAYDKMCFPGLAAEWAKWEGQRPFIGALTMEITPPVDDELTAWVAAGSPPICFGFGSMPVVNPASTVEMIAQACAELGERALICSGWTDFNDVPQFDHVKVVGAVSYAAIFPACRAVVHHGGSGTLAAGLRAGIPTLVLWTAGDQPFWAAQLKRMKVGTGRRFSVMTRESLVEDLSQILAPECVARAREVATQMTNAAESVGRAADLLETFARSRFLA